MGRSRRLRPERRRRVGAVPRPRGRRGCAIGCTSAGPTGHDGEAALLVPLAILRCLVARAIASDSLPPPRLAALRLRRPPAALSRRGADSPAVRSRSLRVRRSGRRAHGSRGSARLPDRRELPGLRPQLRRSRGSRLLRRGLAPGGGPAPARRGPLAPRSPAGMPCRQAARPDPSRDRRRVLRSGGLGAGRERRRAASHPERRAPRVEEGLRGRARRGAKARRPRNRLRVSDPRRRGLSRRRRLRAPSARPRGSGHVPRRRIPRRGPCGDAGRPTSFSTRPCRKASATRCSKPRP